MAHERPPHRDHLLLAARERARQLRAALVQQREEGVDTLEVLLAALAVAVQVRTHLQVLEHRHRPEEATILGHDRHAAADPVARRPSGHVLAAEDDRAGARPHEPQDRLQRRRLPRRVPAEQGHELALAHLQLHVLKDVDQAVVGVDPRQLEHAHFVVALLVPR